MSLSRIPIRTLYATIAAVLQSRIRFGHNIYSEDWDALIILDACRVDALREVQHEYEFLTDIESRWSRGSTSKEWLENTFIESYRDEIESTTYITSNYYSTELREDNMNRLGYPMMESEPVGEQVFQTLLQDDILYASEFGDFISLFDKSVYEDGKQLHPDVVTDCAITVGREDDWDRVIIHYMQPHHPFIQRDQPPHAHREPFSYLNDGGDFETVWEGYLDNLRLVLDSVELLLENFDADTTVITADHGELFGEWGQTGHGVGIPHPNLRKVPWVETTASDTGSHEPAYERTDKRASEDELHERLEALGYR